LVIKTLDPDPYPDQDSLEMLDQDSMIRIHSSAHNLSKNTGSDLGFPSCAANGAAAAGEREDG